MDFYVGALPACYGNKALSVLDIRYREGLSDRLHVQADLDKVGAAFGLEGALSRGNFMISGQCRFLGLLAEASA